MRLSLPLLFGACTVICGQPDCYCVCSSLTLQDYIHCHNWSPWTILVSYWSFPPLLYMVPPFSFLTQMPTATGPARKHSEVSPANDTGTCALWSDPSPGRRGVRDSLMLHVHEVDGHGSLSSYAHTLLMLYPHQAFI